MSKHKQLVADIIDRSTGMVRLSDTMLRKLAGELKWQAQAGDDATDLTSQAFALVREAARRARKQSHYPIQIAAGLEIANGGIIEMQTGEGKSLTALLPAFLRALTENGCHVVTANDYLAQRDAEFAQPIFALLGMTVGAVGEDVDPSDRKSQYDCDITFGCAKEFGFDFLRDRLATAAGDHRSVVQRGLFAAIVDEADSVMIDDARTPLLIATAVERDSGEIDLAKVSNRIASLLEAEHDFEIDIPARDAKLTVAGSLKVVRHAKRTGLTAVALELIYQQVENSLTAHRFFERDRQYVVTEGKLQIVDESTGRVAEGRKWQNGLHQALEAKETIETTDQTRTSARITYQNFFRRYESLAGITGTAINSKREFRRIYNLKVRLIPTRLPCQRVSLPSRIFKTQADKHHAVVDEAQRRIDAGQSVLVGTPTVEASQNLSLVFQNKGIVHAVLNCRSHANEAAIIASAGQPGQVTIATNMAGRGTDIKVADEVLKAGGLHVIATEMHSSSRIDRQLAGRTARQGEPGSFQFFLSSEDGSLKSSRPSQMKLQGFASRQRKTERLHEKHRCQLLKQESNRAKQCRRIGLDPILEFLE